MPSKKRKRDEQDANGTTPSYIYVVRRFYSGTKFPYENDMVGVFTRLSTANGKALKMYNQHPACPFEITKPAAQKAAPEDERIENEGVSFITLDEDFEDPMHDRPRIRKDGGIRLGSQNPRATLVVWVQRMVLDSNVMKPVLVCTSDDDGSEG